MSPALSGRSEAVFLQGQANALTGNFSGANLVMSYVVNSEFLH
jgi:hypothetical protein